MIIFLVGYMACGKTTLGEALAKAGLVHYVDLDGYITDCSGMSPAEWFELRGEKAFRHMETKALDEIIESHRDASVPIVVGCGGGTPCNGSAMDAMLAAGEVVWLVAPHHKIVRRLMDTPGDRPLILSKSEMELNEFISDHYARRVPFYERATHVFDSSRLDTAEEIADTVAVFSEKFLK